MMDSEWQWLSEHNCSLEAPLPDS